MADFVAVIRKAVDNLPENTPEIRARVYDKARAAIRRQLEAINPQPSDEVIARQLDKLDLAIDEVELEHAEALPADEDETDALMAELESMVEKSPVIAETAPQAPAAAPPAPEEPQAPPPGVPASQDYAPEPYAPEPSAPAEAPLSADAAATAPVSDPAVDTDTGSPAPEFVGAAHDEAFGLGAAAQQPERASRAGGSGPGKRGMLALRLVLLLGIAAFAGWSYKDSIGSMFGSATMETPVASDEGAAEPAAETPAETATETPAEAAAPEPVADEPATETAALAPADDDGKFTQRLAADGTETDAGPAPGPAPDDTVEGRSVAELTDDGPAEDAVAAADAADSAASTDTPVTPAAEPLGVTQKMILYEERLGQQSLEVKEGTVVWTTVSEPSGDGPDETVIRGEINNPDKGLSALVTIKRNTDPSLPASHIVEVVFALPADFDGGSIDQLQRIALKQTEADQGNPLIAVPAKITQDFYMVALNDLDEARKTNTELLRQRNWIDIPVVYANGRQALITLEKGASGTEVFNQALDAWAKATPQN